MTSHYWKYDKLCKCEKMDVKPIAHIPLKFLDGAFGDKPKT
jgi:hypothetical protein